MNDIYRIKVKYEDIEIEVESTDADYVEKNFEKIKAEFLNNSASIKTEKQGPTGEVPNLKSGKGMSMAEFVRIVKPKSGTDYAVTIGYYVEKIQSHGSFSGTDIKNGFLQVKFQHSNPSDTINKAKSTGKVMDSQERGSYVLTQTGEEWVEERLK
jgi:hypothetical protein